MTVAMNRSSPAPPVSVFAPALPVSVSFPAPPVTFSMFAIVAKPEALPLLRFTVTAAVVAP